MRLRPLLLMARMLIASCMVQRDVAEEKGGRLSGLQIFLVPSNNGGNNLMTEGLPQRRRQASIAAHADAAIFALVQDCFGRQSQGGTRLSFIDKMSHERDELIL